VGRNLTERVTRHPRVRRVTASAFGVLSLLVLTGCSEETKDEWKRLGLPEAASDRATYIHDLWIGSWIAALITGGFVWGLIIWASIRYRRRDNNQLPVQVRYNLPIEVLYTIAPVVVVAVLFFFTVEKQNAVLKEVDHPDHEVTVTAQQWSWTFNYLHESGAGGDDVWESGTPAIEPELWLVKGETVTFNLYSPDVIHSFWVPAFYFKRDVIPGRQSSFSITPTAEGTFVGRCAELCGYQHSRMLFEVVVTTRDKFDEHMSELKDSDQVGVLCGGSQSTTVSGLETTDQGGCE
jgi:cytochrome c oxidase subunit 2